MVLLIAVLAMLGIFLELSYPEVRSRSTAARMDPLSPGRYQPMLRLLENDLRFLRAQPGFSAEAHTRLRAQRGRVFRVYLRCLETDFERACVALKYQVAQSRQGRCRLVLLFGWHHMLFSCSMARVRCRLMVYDRGWGTVDAGHLVRRFGLALAALAPPSKGNSSDKENL
jgi:hypothetical protein